MATWTAPAMWKGAECWVIGGGSSLIEQFNIPSDLADKVYTGERSTDAYSSFLKPIHSKHIIGINNAYQLGTWIDVCFFGDCNWYLTHRTRLATYPGLKVTSCPRFANKPKNKNDGLKYVAKDRKCRQGISPALDKVAWNGNSGAAAISLAVHFGVERIVLIGFDMNKGQVPNNKLAHWHRGHGSAKNPPFTRHLRGWPKIAEDARKFGVEVLNASPNSSIDVFPKVTVESMLT